MLNYSFSTVLMTVLTSTVLIGIIAACFHNKKVLISIGYKLIGAFLLLTLIRFIIPLEMPFTRTILLPKWLSAAILFIRHPFFTLGSLKISVWFVFECIWLCGSVFTAIKIIRRRITFHRGIIRYGKNVTDKEPYVSVLRKVCDSHKNDLRIIRVFGLDTPQQYGVFHPSILIPAELELTDSELYYTICHEFSHYKRRDFLIKFGMNILVAIYWWNPLCHVLSQQVDVMLEMHVDEKLTLSDPNIKKEYVETLMHIGYNIAAIQEQSLKPSYLVSPKAVADFDELIKRVHILYRDEKDIKRSKLISAPLFGVVAALFLFSYCFIFEAHYLLNEYELETPEIQEAEMYAVTSEDGAYDIYWNSQLIEHVDSLDYYPGVPIIDSRSKEDSP